MTYEEVQRLMAELRTRAQHAPHDAHVVSFQELMDLLIYVSTVQHPPPKLDYLPGMFDTTAGLEWHDERVPAGAPNPKKTRKPPGESE